MMNETERAILQTLKELDAAVQATRAAGPGPDFLPLFSRIDQLADRLPADTAPDLVHYLRKKSYEKARLWLESRQAEIARGGCRGD